MKDLSVVCPCYNEVENLPDLLLKLEKLAFESGCKIIFIDDGSNDGSGEILKANKCIFTKTHAFNRGYGAALKTGFQFVETKYVISFDADGQHKVDNILNLYKKIKEKKLEVVIGVRTGVFKENYLKTFGKWILRFCIVLGLGLKLEDHNSGLKIYKTSAVKKIINLCPDSMSFSETLPILLSYLGYELGTCNIEVLERQAGVSKIRVSDFFETVFQILALTTLLKPMRLFGPLSFGFILAGSIWSLIFILQNNGISICGASLLIIGLLFFTIGLISNQLRIIYLLLINNNNA